MSKLQEIKRKDGTSVYSLNLPKKVMNVVNWQKGDELIYEAVENSDGTYKILVHLARTVVKIEPEKNYGDY
ncbi:MAG: hypothetical protein ACTSU7_00170 [Candidatus Heimdallarchaeaceae archaeon]